MINLMNTHTGEYLHVLENTKFTFEAENQMQNLDSYNIGFSFDIELVNDDNSRDAVINSGYETGKYRARYIDGTIQRVPILAYPKVILYNNGVPLFIGNVVLLSSDIDTIKAAYKCVPYGGCFNKFEFKDHLYDYLDASYKTYENKQLRDIYTEGKMQFSISGYSLDPTDTYIPSVNFVYENNSSKLLPFRSNVYVEDQESGWNILLDSKHRKYWATFSINPLLECMRIATHDADDDYKMAIPLRITYTRMLKVRMYPYRMKDDRTKVNFISSVNTEIYWLNEHTGNWEQLENNTDNVPVFTNSIRKMKGIDGLKFKEVTYPVGFHQYGILGLNTNKGYQSINFGVAPDHTYSDNDDIVIRTEGVSTQVKLPDYVDVLFEYECDLKPDDYYENEDLNAGTPFMDCDIAFFGTETNKFLNELSLNNSQYKWLRNPAYFNKYNYSDVHGQKTNWFDTSFQSIDNVESIVREVSYDSPSSVKIITPIGFSTIYTKDLNSSVNDAKEITFNFTGLGIIGNYTSDPVPERGIPPLIWDNKSSEYVENELEGCFGQIVTNTTSGFRDWIANCNSDYDYVDDYSDKSNKYTFNVVGYNFQEMILFEGKYFVVNKYSTEDFAIFELECYPLTLPNARVYEDPQVNWHDTRGQRYSNASKNSSSKGRGSVQ